MRRIVSCLLFICLISSCADNEKKQLECLDRLLLEGAKTEFGKQVFDSFKDTLSSWKKIMPNVLIERYNFVPDGLIIPENKKQGVLFLIMQRKLASIGADHVKMIVFEEVNGGVSFYHKGSLNMVFSNYLDETIEAPFRIDSLKMLYRKTVIKNYQILDEVSCKLNSEFYEVWIDNNYLVKKHEDWLEDPKHF
ncbi:hypothetical protein [Brumimicrobium mesophilum]|uniref:hypothetical protein n=1 Tax=Brumimicrobium mesophilum TaxID=392717 RepID=UPI000D13FF3C|nr:hypothetical protein [Brumimicrobium mesophilum]